MDDCELQNQGLSGWAGFQLGRMFAEHLQSSAETAAVLLGQKRHVVDANTLLTENHALQQEIAQLRQQLADYERNYNNLRQWADDAWKRLKAYRSNKQG